MRLRAGLTSIPKVRNGGAAAFNRLQPPSAVISRRNGAVVECRRSS
jgi:hypothetical protein